MGSEKRYSVLICVLRGWDHGKDGSPEKRKTQKGIMKSLRKTHGAQGNPMKRKSRPSFQAQNQRVDRANIEMSSNGNFGRMSTMQKAK
jgi:hypothetical protein